MNIYVESPHQLIRESLSLLLAHRHQVTSESEADVTIRDVRGYPSPLPVPSALPTLALICNEFEAHKAKEVIQRGYRGYLGPETGIEQLEQALQTLHRGETWYQRP